jgi:protein-tyrosine kinase
MVNTTRLEKLLNLSSKGVEDAAKPVAVVQRRNLALSGVRDMRRDGRGRALSTADQARIDAAWDALGPAQRDPDPDPKVRQFNQLARAESITSGFDILRTQLAQTFQKRSLRVLGITAPHSGAGTSFAVAGLLASFARRRAQRVVGLDLCQNGPQLHRYFEIVPPHPILPLVEGHMPIESHLVRATPLLALGLNAPDPAHLGSVLPADGLGDLLGDLMQILAPDLVICDLPPLLAGDAALSLVPLMDAVLVVSDGQRTRAADIAACERALHDQTEFLGVVMNRLSGGGQRG